MARHTVTVRNHQSDQYVFRRGKTLAEYLCERSYYTYFDAMGRQHGAIHLHQPRSTHTGNTAQHLHKASEMAHDTFKEKGHKGISISHMCFDRAKMRALVDLQIARRNIWADGHMQKAGDRSEYLKDWCFGKRM